MGYEGQTVNGLSSVGPKMGKTHGGGVNLDRKSIGKLSSGGPHFQKYLYCFISCFKQ